MPKSMTAFARIEAPHGWGVVTWEIHSLNQRFLDINFRMPETLRHMEFSLRESTRKQLQRGKLECRLDIKLAELSATAIDPEKTRHYFKACRDIEAIAREGDTHIKLAPYSALDLLSQTGVLSREGIAPEILSEAVGCSYEQTLQALIVCREREGATLKDLLDERLVKLRELTNKVRDSLPMIRADQQQRLRKRIADITPAGEHTDEFRLEQELAYLANKSDIDEELDRLDTHANEFARILKTREPMGRRLDFLLQELNREANTLAAKSTAATQSLHTVEMKVLIEQMREQVQNIE